MFSSSSNSSSRQTPHDRVRGLFADLSACAAGVILLFNLAISTATATNPQEEAETLLYSYFTALRAGDVTLLGEVLGGDLKKSRSGLLHNPDYGLDLVQVYANVEFDIVDYEILDSGNVVATVDVWLSASERIRHRLVLERRSAIDGFQIVGSEVVP